MIYMRNSFKPYLYGKLQGFDGGTIVRCHLTLHPLVIGLLICLASIGAVAVVMLHDWNLVLFPLLIFLGGLSWGERELIVYDLAIAINARPDVDGYLLLSKRRAK